jgi:hypothetical protein
MKGEVAAGAMADLVVGDRVKVDKPGWVLVLLREAGGAGVLHPDLRSFDWLEVDGWLPPPEGFHLGFNRDYVLIRRLQRLRSCGAKILPRDRQ